MTLSGTLEVLVCLGGGIQEGTGREESQSEARD